MKKLMIPAAIAALACGCTSINTYRDGEVYPQEGLQDYSSNPYRIDYDLGKERVKGVGKSECWCWFFSSGDGRHMMYPGVCFDSGVATAKESATFDAAENSKADAIMGAMYRYTKISKWFGFYKSVDCEVIGFPAKVSGIKKIEDRPVLLRKEDQVIRLKPWEKL